MGGQGTAFKGEREREQGPRECCSWLFSPFPQFPPCILLGAKSDVKAIGGLQSRVNTEDLTLPWHEVAATFTSIGGLYPHPWGWCEERNGAWRRRSNQNSASTFYPEKSCFPRLHRQKHRHTLESASNQGTYGSADSNCWPDILRSERDHKSPLIQPYIEHIYSAHREDPVQRNSKKKSAQFPLIPLQNSIKK